MSGLTQRRFSALLRDGQAAFGVTNETVAERTGIDVTTISRYRSPDYKSGPPSEARRGMLERAIGLPDGYLSGTLEITPEKLRALASQRPAGTQNGGQKGATGSEGTRASDSATVQVVSEHAMGYESRGPHPRGRWAAELLEHRLRQLDQDPNRPVTREERRELLQLAQWAREADAEEGGAA